MGVIDDLRTLVEYSSVGQKMGNSKFISTLVDLDKVKDVVDTVKDVVVGEFEIAAYSTRASSLPRYKSVMGAPYSMTHNVDQFKYVTPNRLMVDSSGSALADAGMTGFGEAYRKIVTDAHVLSLIPGRMGVNLEAKNLLKSIISDNPTEKTDDAAQKTNLRIEHTKSSQDAYISNVAHSFGFLRPMFKASSDVVTGYENKLVAKTDKELKTYVESELNSPLHNVSDALGGFNNLIELSYYVHGELEGNISISNTSGQSYAEEAFTALRDGKDKLGLGKEGLSIGLNDSIDSGKSGIINLKSLLYDPVIPDLFKESSSERNYTISLRFNTPYGNDDGIIDDILLPLNTLIPFVAPLEHTNSFGLFTTAPFYVTAFVPGVFYIHAGLITNMTITPKAYNNDGVPTDVAVELSIIDLSPELTSTNMYTTGAVSPNNMVTHLGALLGTPPSYLLSKEKWLNKLTDKINNKITRTKGIFTSPVNKIYYDVQGKVTDAKALVTDVQKLSAEYFK